MTTLITICTIIQLPWWQVWWRLVEDCDL